MKAWNYNPTDNDDTNKWMAAAMERVSALFEIAFDLYANTYIEWSAVPYSVSPSEAGLKEALCAMLEKWRAWGGGFVVKYNKNYWIACPFAFSVVDMGRHKVLFAIEGERDYREKFGTIGISGTYEEMADQIISYLYA